jgi:hypothetical protein
MADQHRQSRRLRHGLGQERVQDVRQDVSQLMLFSALGSWDFELCGRAHLSQHSPQPDVCLSSQPVRLAALFALWVLGLDRIDHVGETGQEVLELFR